MIEKIQPCDLFVTHETKEQVDAQIDLHNAEEQQMIWYGFFIANNFIAHIVNDKINKHREELEKLMHTMEVFEVDYEVKQQLKAILENHA